MSNNRAQVTLIVYSTLTDNLVIATLLFIAIIEHILTHDADDCRKSRNEREQMGSYLFMSS